MSPPDDDVLSPLDTVTRPPAAVSPLPTTILRLPLVPDVAEPVRSTTEPLLPSLLVPVFKDTDPLTPSTPASVVLNEKEPLEVAIPYPPTSDTEPPVLVVLSPEDTTMRPPAPVLPEPTTTANDGSEAGKTPVQEYSPHALR